MKLKKIPALLLATGLFVGTAILTQTHVISSSRAADAAPAQKTQSTKPNIIVIMGDDIGWMNVSSYGGDIMGVTTPNIDSIGKDGLRLTSYYAQPSSTAGRAAFLTGELPIRSGLSTVGTPGSPVGLDDKTLTLAQVLKDQGYDTAQFGKNHLGDLDRMLPCNHGFDVYWGNLYHLNANEDPFDPDYPTSPEFRKKYMPRNVTGCTAGGPITDGGPLSPERMKTFDNEVTERSIKFLEDHATAGSKPFFLWHNSTRNHVFLHMKDDSKKESRGGYEDDYGNALKEHDNQVGELLKTLKDTGLDKNTIVIYTTDNGAYQYMWPQGGTTPFRGDKGTTWEGGVRVPAMIRWPGAPAGRVSSEIVDSMDLFPTLAAAAGDPNVVEKVAKGAKYGGRTYREHLDGVNQMDFFTGKKDTSNRISELYYDGTNLTAIRYKQYKVTFSYKPGDKWDSPLLNLARPQINNIVMDPFERQWGDVDRQYSEHKTWILTPVAGLVQQHLVSFQKYPITQRSLPMNFGRQIQGALQKILISASSGG